MKEVIKKMLTIFLVVYLVCAFGSYQYFQKSYSVGGKFESIDPDGADIVLVLTPVYNIPPAVMFVTGGYKAEVDSTDSYRKFFGLD